MANPPALETFLQPAHPADATLGDEPTHGRARPEGAAPATASTFPRAVPPAVAEGSAWPVTLAIATTVTIWASAFVAIRAGLRVYSPVELAVLRFAVASLLFGVRAAFRPVRVPSRRDWPQVALAGILGFAIYGLLINAAEVRVAAGMASFVVNTVPVFTAILATLFLGEKLGRRGWVGLAVSLVGAALISFGATTRIAFEPAILVLVAAAAIQGSSFTLQKSVLARYDAIAVTSWGVWAGTACLLPFLPGALRHALVAPPAASLCAIYLAAFPTVLGYGMWAFAISRRPVGRVTAFLYFIPVLATLLGWLLLGERPTPLGLLGGAVAIGGVILVNLARRPKAVPTRDRRGAP